MRFLFAVIDSDTNTGTPSEMVEIDAFCTRLTASGQLVALGGLTSPSDAYVVDNRHDVSTIQNGPLNVTAEHMSGFWIIDAPDEAEARELALEASRACNRRIEVRRFL